MFFESFRSNYFCDHLRLLRELNHPQKPMTSLGYIVQKRSRVGDRNSKIENRNSMVGRLSRIVICKNVFRVNQSKYICVNLRLLRELNHPQKQMTFVGYLVQFLSFDLRITIIELRSSTLNSRFSILELLSSTFDSPFNPQIKNFYYICPANVEQWKRQF